MIEIQVSMGRAPELPGTTRELCAIRRRRWLGPVRPNTRFWIGYDLCHYPLGCDGVVLSSQIPDWWAHAGD